MKKFLLIQSRPEDLASDGEYQSFLRIGGLLPDEVYRVRGEKPGALADINVDDYVGIIIGGGPFNASDPEDKKTPEQKQLEENMYSLLTEILEKDIPFLGVCYGIGLLTKHQQGVLSRKYSEPISVTDIVLTDEGKQDPLLQNVGESFKAITAHKEACEVLPSPATLLASSESCPVQMVRFGDNVYITQFHPELEIETLVERIWIYKNYGYFKPEEAQDIIDSVTGKDVSTSWQVLKSFVKYYRNN